MKVLNKIILVIVFISFIWIFIGSFIYGSSVYYQENSFISIGIGILIGVGLYSLYKFIIKKKILKKTEFIIFMLYILIVTILQYIVLKNLNVIPSWDYGVIFDNALKYVNEGTRHNAVYIEYFQYFPNNILIFCLMTLFIKIGTLFHVGALISIEFMNVSFIDFALVILYLTVRKMYSVNHAIFSNIITLLFIPLFLYSPVVYSDTLSLFVGISFIYLFTFIDKKTICKKNVFISILIGILMFIGKSIKITSLIVLIAIFIKYIFSHKIKNTIFIFMIIFMSFGSLNLVFNKLIVNNNKLAFQVNDYGQYPYTHWLMMGIEDIDADNTGRNSYGGYNEFDYNKTRNFSTGKEASAYNIKEYKNRLKKMGFGGYLNYLTKKVVNTWSDGYYFANVALNINPINETNLRNFLIKNDTRYIGIYFTKGIQYLFLMCLLLGCMVNFRSNNKEIDYIRLAILGLMIFLLFWETRSRYLVNFIPLFILIIVDFYKKIDFDKKIDKMKRSKNE